MYEKFYGFSEKPFNTTPDSKFFFPSSKHTDALNSLIYAINERKGFVVITGEIGAGKTTVTRALLNKLDLNTKAALITNSHITQKELIAQILEELEVGYAPGGKQKLLSQLNNYLVRQLAQDINVVLIIDEAQNLTPKVLEEVRMLSNLETEKEKLIQIILIGQPQLKTKLQNPKSEQFKQRIAVYYHISPLNLEETKTYILHRLKLVSSNGLNIFSPKAIEALHYYSGGIPRTINLICDSALLSGYASDTKEITEKIIYEAVKERTLDNNPIDEDVSLAKEKIRIHCCFDCQEYSRCLTKWIRGTHGEEQLCCSQCKDYAQCIANTKREALTK
jgi:general secretion pathway protein A